MLKNKRFYIAILCIAIILIPLLRWPKQPVANAEEIKDLPACSDYARPAVERLAEQKIISGDTNGYFKPKNTITRAEMIAIMIRALHVEEIAAPTAATFKDVPLEHWANKYVETAYARGIVKGISNDTFGVNKPCTREEMAAMFVRAFQSLNTDLVTDKLPAVDLSVYQDQAKLSSWAKDSMSFALYSGLLFGTSQNTVSPQARALREQAAVLIDRFLDRSANIKEDLRAAALLQKAGTSLVSANMLANHSVSKTHFSLYKAQGDLPQEFEVTTDSVNEAVLPGTMHSLTRMEMPELSQTEYPPYKFEQYLVSNIIYEKIVDGNTSVGWERNPALSNDKVSQLLSTVKESLQAMLDPGLLAHQTGTCKIENTTVNGSPVYKITYTGKIADLDDYLLEVLPSLMPQDTSAPENWMEDILRTYTGAAYTQIYYLNTENGKLLGTDLKIQIDCQQSANADLMPIKTLLISAVTDDYRYDGINIVLPDEASNAPEKKN